MDELLISSGAGGMMAIDFTLDMVVFMVVFNSVVVQYLVSDFLLGQKCFLVGWILWNRIQSNGQKDETTMRLQLQAKEKLWNENNRSEFTK